MRTILLVAAVALTATSCGAFRPKVDLSGAAVDAEAGHGPFYANTSNGALLKVQGVRSILTTAADARRDLQYNASEFAFYATLASAVGVAVKSVDLRNVAFAAAAVAGIITGRYQLPLQRAAILKAKGRAECIEEALLATGAAETDKSIRDNSDPNKLRSEVEYISPRQFAHGTAQAIIDQDSRDAGQENAVRAEAAATYVTDHNRIPAVTTSALIDLANQLTSDLDAVQLTSLTRAQMTAILAKAREADEAAKEKGVQLFNEHDPKFVEVAPAYVAVTTYEEKVAACFVP